MGNTKKNEIFNGKCGFSNLPDFINKIKALKSKNPFKKKVALLSQRVISVLLGRKISKKYPFTMVGSLDELFKKKIAYIKAQVPNDQRLKLEAYISEILVVSLYESRYDLSTYVTNFSRVVIFLFRYEENIYKESDLTEELFEYIISDKLLTPEERDELSNIFIKERVLN